MKVSSSDPQIKRAVTRNHTFRALTGYIVDGHLMVSPIWGDGDRSNVIPLNRPKASRALLKSALAHPLRRLEVPIILEGAIADRVFIAAGQKCVSPSGYIVEALRAPHGGGAS